MRGKRPWNGSGGRDQPMAKSKGSNGESQSAVARQNAGTKPTEREQRQRFREAQALLARRYRPEEVSAALQDKWGMGHTAADRYVRAARDSMVEVSREPIAELLAASVATYDRVLQDPKATNSEIISAQKAKDDLYGLQQARKIAHQFTTTDGQDVLQGVVDRMTPEQLEVYSQIGGLFEEAERGEIHSTQALEGPEVK